LSDWKHYFSLSKDENYQNMTRLLKHKRSFSEQILGVVEEYTSAFVEQTKNIAPFIRFTQPSVGVKTRVVNDSRDSSFAIDDTITSVELIIKIGGKNPKNGEIFHAAASETLIDITCWSPYLYDDKLFVTDAIYHFDEKEPTVSPADKTHSNCLMPHVTGFVNKNFSFIMTSDHLAVVSISYLIWDTIRMITVNLNCKNNLKQYHKYANKYFHILDSLFDKLKCTEPFMDACKQCASDTKQSSSLLPSQTYLNKKFIQAIDKI
jgi:hypothetical protein